MINFLNYIYLSRSFSIILLLFSLLFITSEINATPPIFTPQIVATTATPEVLPKVEPNPELSSPRSVINTFLTAMELIEAGDESAISRATNCFDLQDIPEIARVTQGREIAAKLLAIINRTSFDRHKVPTREQGAAWVLRDDALGRVIIEFDGINWRFSRESVKSIPSLYVALENQEPLQKIKNDSHMMTASMTVRSYVPLFLKTRTFYLEDWQWFGIVCSLIVAWAIKASVYRLLNFISHSLLTRAVAQAVSENIHKVLKPVAWLAFALVMHGAIAVLDLLPDLYSFLLRFFSIVEITATFVIFYRAIGLIVGAILARPERFFAKADEVLLPLIGTLLRILLIILGVIYVADLFGVNLTGLIAGLGLGGLALALAAKDTVENIFGSVTVLLDHPFGVGDSIVIDGFEGVVEKIGLRSTRIRTPQHSVVSIPNSKLISASVENLGARRFWRTRTILSLVFDIAPEKLQAFCEGIRELLKRNPKARSDYQVYLHEFGHSSLNIVVQVYFSVLDAADDISERERFFLQILKLSKALDIEFAYPTQTHHQRGELIKSDDSSLSLEEWRQKALNLATQLVSKKSS